MEGEGILLGVLVCFFTYVRKTVSWTGWNGHRSTIDSNCTAVMCSNLPTKRGCFVFCCCILLKLNNVFTLFLLSPFPVNEGDTAPAAPHTKLLKCLSPKGKRIGNRKGFHGIFLSPEMVISDPTGSPTSLAWNTYVTIQIFVLLIMRILNCKKKKIQIKFPLTSLLGGS